MSVKLPHALAGASNNEPMIMDRSNVAHKPRGASDYQAACGARGHLVTLAQALVYATVFCGHAYCYQLHAGGRKPREAREAS